MLKDLRNFMNFLNNYSILEDLQLFKPICDIVTPDNIFDHRNKRNFNLLHKRNIIRQWFKYVIWANRLKKEKQKHK